MSKPGDPRLGTLIHAGIRDTDDIVLVGFPHDEGCIRNGGRPGSKGGPAAFRQFVGKMGCVVNREYRVDLSSIRIGDAGDIAPDAATLEEAHAELRRVVRGILARGAIPFVVGGSNDQSSSLGKALLDVIVGSEDEAAASRAVFVSFDIDAISGADCPGVSCPATIGLTAQDAFDICVEAGACARTRLVDLSEMNPAVEGYRTPRLAVNMFYAFLIGFARRRQQPK